MPLPIRFYFATALLAAVPVFAADTLDDVLARLDKAASSFESMTGKISKITYTKVLNDKSDPELGLMWVKRTGAKGMKVLIRIDTPDPKQYAFEGQKGEIYYPKLKLVQEYNLGRQKGLLDQFLLLGFGTSRVELLKNYDIQSGGEETLAGQNTSRLQLVPKSPAAREYLAVAVLWITAEGRTVQQKFTEPSGDYRVVTFTEAKWNAALADSAVRLDLPGNVKREFPQKSK